MCIDYRELNKVTKGDTYPMPRIEEMLDKFGKSNYFCLFDLRSAYWQVPLAPSAREKTAFTTKSGHYEFTRMSMGLKTAPATFQRTVDMALVSVKDFASPYLDDVATHGEGYRDSLWRAIRVVDALSSAKLCIKDTKCCLMMKKMIYLGYLITEFGVTPDPKKISAIVELATPTNPTAVKSALGIYVQFRRFMPFFADMAAPLSDLLKKGKPWTWTEEAQNHGRH